MVNSLITNLEDGAEVKAGQPLDIKGQRKLNPTYLPFGRTGGFVADLMQPAGMRSHATHP